MNAALSLIAVPLITVQLFVIDSISRKPCKDADLTVEKIHQPEWDHDNQRTIVKIDIRNIGNEESEYFFVTLMDLDISAEEVKSAGYDDVTIEMIEENNARAEYYDDEDMDESPFDYDLDFKEVQSMIGLMPDEKQTIIFYINDHWVYDSNCELRVIIDEDEEIKDCDRSNNQKDFFGWG